MSAEKGLKGTVISYHKFTAIYEFRTLFTYPELTICHLPLICRAGYFHTYHVLTDTIRISAGLKGEQTDGKNLGCRELRDCGPYFAG